LQKYNALFILVVILLVVSIPVLAYAIIEYPKTNPAVTVPKQTPFNSTIPTHQSGMTQFAMPLPIQGWNLTITVVCTLKNLTNQGVCQYSPVKISVTLIIQNLAPLSVANQYMTISWFTVQPTNAIEVSYLPNSNSPRLNLGVTNLRILRALMAHSFLMPISSSIK
jgi:hypothetical protein